MTDQLPLDEQEHQWLREIELAGDAERLLNNSVWTFLISDKKAQLTEELVVMDMSDDTIERMKRIKVALSVLSSMEEDARQIIETGRMAGLSLSALQESRDGRGARNEQPGRRRSRSRPLDS